MSNKTLAILSYITVIGWLVSFFSSTSPRDPLVKYHLKQGLSLVSLVFLILLIIGAINANKENETPLPVIGKLFENKFDFIN